jgi:predicted GIY-YIG superfamily endonuclease
MFVDDYGRTWNGPFEFNLTEIARWSRLMRNPGVYQIFYRKTVVYIGISSVSVHERLQAHVTGTGNKLLAHRTDHLNFEFMYFLCDPDSAGQIESHVLNEKKPACNRKIEYANYIANITVH